MTRSAKQTGYILLPVIVVITLVAAIALLMNTESALESNTAGSELDAQQAQYVAEAGLNHALWLAQQQGCGPYADLTNEPLGNDKYTTNLITDLGSTTGYSSNVDQDTWIRSANPDQNNGTGNDLHVLFESGDSERALLRFDLSSIPATSTILSATAWFYVNQPHPEGSVDIHRITADWIENDATWNTMNANMDSTVITSIPPQPATDVWVAVNLTSQVQAWINGQPNYGIMLNTTSEGVDGRYDSRESSNAPYLEVIVGVPPTSPALLKAGGTLANGVTRDITRNDVVLVQQPGFVQLRPDGAAGQDTYLYEWKPTWNYGTSNDIWVDDRFSDSTAHGLIRFNLGAIPAGARVASARLELYRVNPSLSGGPIGVYPISAGWDEGTRSGGAGISNWTQRNVASSWTNAGGDFASQRYALETVPAGTGWSFWEIGDLVDAWVGGRFPNQGLALLPETAGSAAHFASSDATDPALWPKLSVTFACACGEVCVAPQGSLKVLMVVGDDSVLTPGDLAKKDLMESWGYTVDLANDNTSASALASAMDTRDVLYVAASVGETTIGTKLTGLAAPIVNEKAELADEIGFAAGATSVTGDATDIVDTDHYITRPFATGPLTIYRANMVYSALGGALSPDLQTLARFGADAGLATLDSGGQLASGGSAPARRVMLPFAAADDFNWDYLNANGRMLLQRALAWGAGLGAAPPSTKVLFVVPDATALGAQDLSKKALMESWGFSVTLITAADSQGDFDTAVANVDVAYVSEEITSSDLNTKLRNATIGVVNEETALNDEFGISSTRSGYSGTDIEIVDTTHYITSVFTAGSLTIASSATGLDRLDGTLAPDLDPLAQTSGNAELATIETGGQLYDTGNAAGRRVKLPWGTNDFDINLLNADGETLMRRAIEWGAGIDIVVTPFKVLFVVGDIGGPGMTAEEIAHQALIESWGHTVELIEDGATQGDFDTAVANNDVVFTTNDITASSLGTKLVNATIGVVTSEVNLSDEFGMASAIDWESGTEVEINDNSHYITSPFSLGLLTILSTSESLAYVTGTLSPDLGQLASSTSGYGVVTLDTGEAMFGGGPAAGRRVQLPWGGNGFDPNHFTDDGRTILKRALEWGSGMGATGPIAHWKLDDGVGPTAIDSVGGNDATLNGNPDWTTGTLNGALKFDGGGDYATTDNNFTPPPVGTVSFWMKVPGSPASHGRILGLDDAWEIRHVTAGTSDGIPYGLVFDLGVTGVNTEFVTTVTVDTPDQWYFVAATYDTSNDSYAVYLDGVLHKSGTYPSALAVPADNPLSLGTRTGSTNYFDGTLDDVRVYNYALSAAAIADLFAAGGGGGGPPTIFEVRVATGSDDAEERVSNGNVNHSSSDLELVSDGSNNQLVGMRFTNVTIPNGATISSAYIQFQVDETNSGATSVNIQGQAIDDAPTFTTGNSDISSRSRTSATVPWTLVPWTTVGEAGPDQRTPDITSVIQEIINRPGWASGNDLVIIVTGSGERTAESYNGDSSGAALLHIEY